MRVTVEAIGAAADGIARDEAGRPLFIPFALPGETVEAAPGPMRGEGRTAALITVEAPSPDRVAPPCPHFGICGGCAVQHWAPPAVAAWKAARVSEALSRAGFPGITVDPAVPSPPNTRRRADFALRRRSQQEGSGITVGFHARGSAEPFDMATCFVIDPRLLALVAPLRAMLAGLPALRRAGSAMVNLLDSGPDLWLRTDGVLTPADRTKLAAFAEANGIARIAWSKEGTRDVPEIAAQSGTVQANLSGVAVTPAPGAFLQATPHGEAAIVAAVLAGLPKRMPGKPRIIELHAGLGTLTFPLAARGRVDAFEGAPEAAAALHTAAGRAGARVRAERRDLVRQPLLPAELKGAAALVLDPPFAGAAEQAAILARSTVPRVIYVSCNPAALSRDLAPFARAPGWRVESAVAVDQFLWSTQVEAVVTLARGP
ncbi:class I SAM-dependent RNA methyltransferase [Pararoseomonas indoligenes]|uniref:Class I SAM-dependent RNA methyltransferase n=1 Tax=Roseomonas indoligenes TaxID=2820811 RepID=A0A940MQY3_9PROT|nr:TRAM domain-containing protein [Pararoseomonas indoligenes]MBP0492393.1 class I SAM-dependent RNA methyltransferase [Pararoseomonas indoligenes]